MEEKRFNWATFLGLCTAAIILAFAITNAASVIAGNMNNAAHTIAMLGNHQIAANIAQTTDNEFMSEWEAAVFLSMGFDDFSDLLQAGELYGTYAIFEVQRQVLVRPDGTMWAVEDRDVWVAEQSAVPTPAPIEFETISYTHRVFSRERLAEWLHNRI